MGPERRVDKRLEALSSVPNDSVRPTGTVILRLRGERFTRGIRTAD